MKYITLICMALLISACEVMYYPNPRPAASVVVQTEPYNEVVYVEEGAICYVEPPYYFGAEWCEYWGNETYCTWYVGWDCYEEWVHDPWCGWSFIDNWCVY